MPGAGGAGQTDGPDCALLLGGGAGHADCPGCAVSLDGEAGHCPDCAVLLDGGGGQADCAGWALFGADFGFWSKAASCVAGARAIFGLGVGLGFGLATASAGFTAASLLSAACSGGGW